jgi:hypothetical protein
MMPVLIIDLGITECDAADDCTTNQGLDEIAAKFSVATPDFHVHCIERISIPPSLTDGQVSRLSDNSATSHARAIRNDVGINRSALK